MQRMSLSRRPLPLQTLRSLSRVIQQLPASAKPPQLLLNPQHQTSLTKVRLRCAFLYQIPEVIVSILCFNTIVPTIGPDSYQC